MNKLVIVLSILMVSSSIGFYWVKNKEHSSLKKTSVPSIEAQPQTEGSPSSSKSLNLEVPKSTNFKITPDIEIIKGFSETSGVLHFRSKYDFKIVSTSRGEIVGDTIKIEGIKGKGANEMLVVKFENLENHGEIIEESFHLFTRKKFVAYLSSESWNKVRTLGGKGGYVDFDSDFEYNILSSTHGKIDGKRVHFDSLAYRGNRPDVIVVLENRDNPGETVEVKF